MFTLNLRRHHRSAFSLIELVVVLVILGVIAAIAIPRMTRGATNAGSVALKSNLQALRGAIELYRSEHNGTFPSAGNVANQLTQYSNASGSSTSDTYSSATGLIYGPYLTKIPPLPVGAAQGASNIGASAGAGIGWIYDATSGTINAATGDAETDSDGVAYNTY